LSGVQLRKMSHCARENSSLIRICILRVSDVTKEVLFFTNYERQ
jgi:hypothetical protein